MNAYDFDNTIYRGDSTADFVLFNLVKQPSLLRFVPRVFFAFFLKALRRKTLTEAKQTIFDMLAHVPSLDDRVRSFWDTHRNKIKYWYPGMQMEDDLIISASPEYLIGPICRELGIRNVIGSRVDPCSGHYAGLNCSGEEKVIRFRAQFPCAHVQNFFSDSLSDTPMALLADQAYLVRGNNFFPWPRF